MFKKNGDVVVEELVFYLYTLSLFLPPPQPPLIWTGLSWKEMRSRFEGADVTHCGDGTFSPETHGRKTCQCLRREWNIVNPFWT